MLFCIQQYKCVYIKTRLGNKIIQIFCSEMSKIKPFSVNYDYILSKCNENDPPSSIPMLSSGLSGVVNCEFFFLCFLVFHVYHLLTGV